MVTVVAVADGASEPVRGDEPTSLERAATPNVDRLLRSGVLQRARTIPAGLLPGTEVGLPALLGVVAAGQPGRGRIEAAAAGIGLAPGRAAWRLDLLPGRTPEPDTVARVAVAARRLGATVHPLGGHRLLLVGPADWGEGPPGPHQTDCSLDEVVAGRFRRLLDEMAAAGVEEPLWPWGTLAGAWPDLPEQLGRRVTVVAAHGAAVGLARLLRCDVEQVPVHQAARIVQAADADDVVVVHDSAADDAAHACDADGKVAALQRFDRDVIGPVAAVLRDRGGSMLVATDHGCDPATGHHDAQPVPVVMWWTNSAEGGHRPRWTERDALRLAPVPAEVLLREQMTVAA